MIDISKLSCGELVKLQTYLEDLIEAKRSAEIEEGLTQNLLRELAAKQEGASKSRAPAKQKPKTKKTVKPASTTAEKPMGVVLKFKNGETLEPLSASGGEPPNGDDLVLAVLQNAHKAGLPGLTRQELMLRSREIRPTGIGWHKMLGSLDSLMEQKVVVENKKAKSNSKLKIPVTHYSLATEAAKKAG